MRLAAVLLVSLATPAAADPGYWDSVLARGILGNVAPCDVAIDDAHARQVPYLTQEAMRGATGPELGTVAAILCARQLGQWGRDPGGMWIDGMRKPGAHERPGG